MKFTSLLCIAISTASIATPASALIGPLIGQVVGQLGVLTQAVPLLLDGLDIVYGFPTCAVRTKTVIFAQGLGIVN